MCNTIQDRQYVQYSTMFTENTVQVLCVMKEDQTFIRGNPIWTELSGLCDVTYKINCLVEFITQYSTVPLLYDYECRQVKEHPRNGEITKLVCDWKALRKNVEEIIYEIYKDKDYMKNLEIQISPEKTDPQTSTTFVTEYGWPVWVNSLVASIQAFKEKLNEEEIKIAKVVALV